MLRSTTRLRQPVSQCVSRSNSLQRTVLSNLTRFHPAFSSLSSSRSKLKEKQRWSVGLHTGRSLRNEHTKPPIKAGFCPPYMDYEEAVAIIERANSVWPAPPARIPIPEGWSCTWDEWPYLFGFYWLSPEYLMLPYIERMVNIKYALPGDARPILFYNAPTQSENGQKTETDRDTEREVVPAWDIFIFTIVERPNEFYLHTEGTLYRFTNPSLTETELVSLLATDPTLSSPSSPLKYEPVPESEEGLKILERIETRDQSVIPDAAKFLGYTPEHTEPSLENLYAPEELETSEDGEPSDEQLEELKRLTRELESRSPEFKEASEVWDKELKGEGGVQSPGISEEDAAGLEALAAMTGLSSDLQQVENMMREAEGDLQKLRDVAKKGKDNTELTEEEIAQLAQQIKQGKLESEDIEEANYKRLSDTLEVNEIDSDRVRVRYTPKEDSQR
ncbi:hypothetical protein D9758_009580 [Tetrapyrgos nigripes]|uniref:Uncharacterized protein n=1 Tax=Tetrapyrgos nigripes TaxID=182062 RepID=A0A8H5LMG4_9AGAR|nr:hypothetical protein D9758_009580 [Tetrapyrgos nigripes]